MQSEKNMNVIRRLAEVINSENLDALDEVLSPGYIRHDPNPLMKDIGREQYKQAFVALKKAFPDATWTIQDLLCDGNRVVGRWKFQGTYHGPFFNIPASGKKVTYPILAIYRIENEKIAEDWHIFHSTGLWQTLIPEIDKLIKQATAS